MGTPKNIAVIMGGYSSEYNISLKSGAVVCKWLDPEAYRAYPVVIRPEAWELKTEDGQLHPVNRHDFTVDLPEGILRFDCVFNAIHGTPGEDGLLQAYFELIGLPLTGCDFYASALTFNKRDLLSVLKVHQVPCARSYHLDKGQPIHAGTILERVGLPCFVKANRSGSSFGVSLVKKAEELDAALEVAFKEDNQVLIEQALQGREVSVGVIRYRGKIQVLPITEICPDNEFFDYEAKYEGKSREITPAPIPEHETEAVRKLAAHIYETLGLQGYSRSEFILVDGIPHLLEVNTTPGLTEASLLPQQAAAAGIPLPELFGSAIEEALGKK
ncbi:D-alanine--D-alanine ligase [Robiginitalea sp. M366]|uniref:D-alanine--D-alanine ligase n=1 Tax=Robiginitalea aestuariiviva TaxID=3036903 RepID=UPI00240E0C5A|nr:D-alanine--D-alanine ligase [Robiginitalea aestuariiviva]MDG1570734.1 D-alanine--D-alanine ligase [Robiginitalea aestuariiviva]